MKIPYELLFRGSSYIITIIIFTRIKIIKLFSEKLKTKVSNTRLYFWIEIAKFEFLWIVGDIVILGGEENDSDMRSSHSVASFRWPSIIGGENSIGESVDDDDEGFGVCESDIVGAGAAQHDDELNEFRMGSGCGEAVAQTSDLSSLP